MAFLVHFRARLDVLVDDSFELYLNTWLIEPKMISNKRFDQSLLVTQGSIFAGEERLDLGASWQGPVEVRVLLKINIIIKVD